MATAPDALLRLVDRFDSDRKVFQSGDYKEEQLRLEFLNPFFTALGWDMDNALDTIRARKWGSVPNYPKTWKSAGDLAGKLDGKLDGKLPRKLR
jgi:hypothetical protein